MNFEQAIEILHDFGEFGYGYSKSKGDYMVVLMGNNYWVKAQFCDKDCNPLRQRRDWKDKALSVLITCVHAKEELVHQRMFFNILFGAEFRQKVKQILNSILRRANSETITWFDNTQFEDGQAFVYLQMVDNYNEHTINYVFRQALKWLEQEYITDKWHFNNSGLGLILTDKGKVLVERMATHFDTEGPVLKALKK